MSRVRSILSSLSVILPRGVYNAFQLHVRLIRCELQMACICVQGPRDGHSTTLKPTQQRLYIDHLWVRTKIIQYRNLTFRKAQKRAGAFGWAPEYLACATSALGGCIACHMYPRMVWKYLSIGGAGLEVGIKGKCGILCLPTNQPTTNKQQATTTNNQPSSLRARQRLRQEVEVEVGHLHERRRTEVETDRQRPPTTTTTTTAPPKTQQPQNTKRHDVGPRNSSNSRRNTTANQRPHAALMHQEATSSAMDKQTTRCSASKHEIALTTALNSVIMMAAPRNIMALCGMIPTVRVG